MKQEDLRTSRLAFAGVGFLTVLTWYAIPDAVRSRRARGLIKAALLAVTAAGVAEIPRVYPEVRNLNLTPQVDVTTPERAAALLGSAAGLTAVTIWGEKAIFGYGERRRERGVRCAHTPLALAMALATGAVLLVDVQKLAPLHRSFTRQG